MIYGVDKIKLVSVYVTGLFTKYQTPHLIYHNLVHTITVVDRAKEISASYPLSETDIFIVLSAAWFHDCGHLFGPPKNHEERSVIKMKECMQTIAVEEEVAGKIEECILATRLLGHPASLPAEILCDADLYHLGTGDFFVTDALVKKEFGARNMNVPSNWNESTLAMLKKHQYYTAYCRNLLNKGKLKNIAYLEGLISKEKI